MKAEQPSLRIRDLFSKFSIADNPVLSTYFSGIPDTLSEAKNILASSQFSEVYSANDYTLANRRLLSQYIRTFHRQANTLTAGVIESIGLLNNPNSKILVSMHQPNLFAYGGVYKKIILLETLRAAVESKSANAQLVNLFLIIDHDFLNDMWIRTAQIPSFKNKGGVLEIRTPVSKSKKWQMVCNAEPPQRNVLDSWRGQLKLWIKSASASNIDKTALLSNLEGLWHEVEEAFAVSKSYADFNSFFQSKVVNEIWGYKTLFVRLSDISPVFRSGFEFLLSNHEKYSKAVERAEKYFIERNVNTGVSSTAYLNAPLWIHCKCGSKASAKIHKANGEMVLRGKCMSCKSDLQLVFENTQELRLSEEHLGKISPRAIPILLLLAREIGVGCFASGTGGSIGYTIVGSLIFNELSIKMPLTVMWPSDDRYMGLGQSEALEHLHLTQKREVFDYLQKLRTEDRAISSEIKPLLEERNRLIAERQPVESILSQIFVLKEQQRRIHSIIKVAERVKGSLKITPCFLDYGINFGMRDIEQQWRQNLTNNDNLMLPSILSFRN
ncbi:MAG: hypothetical protein M3297_11185 [Thermoproteota archaeon]|nr:hypothetical protein [Thermoproteota archaeon]